jgi:glyoxylate carboligase
VNPSASAALIEPLHMKTAEAVVRILEDESIDTAFGIPVCGENFYPDNVKLAEAFGA